MRTLTIDGRTETAMRPIHTAPGHFDADAMVFDGSSVQFVPDIGWVVVYKGIRWDEAGGKRTTRIGIGILILAKSNPEKLLYRSTEPVGAVIIENGWTIGTSTQIPTGMSDTAIEHVPQNVLKEIRRINMLLDRKMLPISQMVVWQQQKSQILGKNFRYGLF